MLVKANTSALIIIVVFAGSRFCSWLWRLCWCSVFFLFCFLTTFSTTSVVASVQAGFVQFHKSVLCLLLELISPLALLKECQVLLTYKQFIMSTTISHLLTEENLLALKTIKHQARNITKTFHQPQIKKTKIKKHVFTDERMRFLKRDSSCGAAIQ